MHLLANCKLMARISLVSKSATQKWHANETATSLCPEHLICFILASVPLAHRVSLRPKPMHSIAQPGQTLACWGTECTHSTAPTQLDPRQDTAGKHLLTSVPSFCTWNEEHIAKTKHLSLVIDTPYLAPLQLFINATFLLLPIRQPQSQKFRLKYWSTTHKLRYSKSLSPVHLENHQ